MNKIIEAAEEAVAVARGDQPAAALWHNGHKYLPSSSLPFYGDPRPMSEAPRDGTKILLKFVYDLPDGSVEDFEGAAGRDTLRARFGKPILEQRHDATGC